MATCIRCGKPCNDGETMCDDCKLWFQQKTGGAVPVSKPQSKKMKSTFAKRNEDKGIESKNNKEQVIRQEEHTNTNNATRMEKKINNIKLNPKVLGIALASVIVIIVVIIILSGKGNDENFTQDKEEYNSIGTTDNNNIDDTVENLVDESDVVDSEVINVNVEDEVLTIREIYNDTVAAINEGRYTEKIISEGIKGYYDETEIKAIIVPHSASDDLYSKSYYYNNGALIFAYYEASDANRLYFVDEQLIRWRYSENSNDPQNAENFDLVQSGEYEYWNMCAIEESDSYIQLVENSSLIQDGDYILPGSDSFYLSKNDLVGLSAEQCRLARNELYARHGRKFDDESLRNYFNQKDWYNGRIDPDDFTEDMLNDYEIYNRDLIVEYEEEKGYR